MNAPFPQLWYPSAQATVGVGPAGSFPVVIEVTGTYGSERAGVVIELLEAVPIPTLSLPMLALLSVLMLLLAGREWRRGH